MKTNGFKLMDEKLLAIVDFGKEKKFYIVEYSDLQAFLHHHSNHSNECMSCPPVIFQSVLVYDPITFQSQLDSSCKSKSMFNPSDN